MKTSDISLTTDRWTEVLAELQRLQFDAPITDLILSKLDEDKPKEVETFIDHNGM